MGSVGRCSVTSIPAAGFGSTDCTVTSVVLYSDGVGRHCILMRGTRRATAHSLYSDLRVPVPYRLQIPTTAENAGGEQTEGMQYNQQLAMPACCGASSHIRSNTGDIIKVSCAGCIGWSAGLAHHPTVAQRSRSRGHTDATLRRLLTASFKCAVCVVHYIGQFDDLMFQSHHSS